MSLTHIKVGWFMIIIQCVTACFMGVKCVKAILKMDYIESLFSTQNKTLKMDTKFSASYVLFQVGSNLHVKY